MWCESEKQCVAKNSYPVSFPYGQCRGWVEELQCSGEYIGVKVALCFSFSCNLPQNFVVIRVFVLRDIILGNVSCKLFRFHSLHEDTRTF